MTANWSITSLVEAESKVVEEAKRYFLDVVGISSTKRRVPNNVHFGNR